MPFRSPDSRTDRRGSLRLLRLLLAVSAALPLVLFAGIGWRERRETQETAEDGVAALELLETDRDFDLVVSDVVMPRGVSGIDLARHIRERWPQLRVLLASGYSPESLATMGADTASVLAKPFTPDQLVARIRALSGA
ncbi:response regulator [Azospirillum humicireducens]|uniref:response regulator n=1 Tax=Azospirillum humicireducens TaxID=1226968 RepID=UPI0007C1015D|nr:response regulator [Azospirillum humicireducens]